MEARFTEESSPIQSTPAIVRRAGERVLELYNQEGDARLVFHNYYLTVELVEKTAEIAQAEQADARDTEVALLAAWFSFTGFLTSYDQSSVHHSLREAERFLFEQDYADNESRQVLQCIRNAGEGQPPQSRAAAILSDASQATRFIEDFPQRSALLRLEREFMLNQRLSRLEWNQLQLQYLLQVKLHTHYAKSTYEAPLAQLIKEQKDRVEKMKDRDRLSPAGADEVRRPFQNLEKRQVPSRATQTFFRANFRNHINLSSIADNKANIMISVNSILISVLITMLSYRNISENQPVVFLPAVIFLVSGLASLIFAVLSARPKVTQFNRDLTNKDEIRKNIVFFGNFVHLDLQEYEEAMDSVFRDEELLYGNMTRDLYFLGKVLDKKYRYLSVSYNIFMVGFIATVVSYLILLFS